MTNEVDPIGFDLDAYIRGLHWSEGTPDIHKTLVAGNLRAMYGHILPKITAAMDVLRELSALERENSDDVLGGITGNVVRDFKRKLYAVVPK